MAKEALHVVLGITPDGHKEVLEYSVYPTESAANYEDLLRRLKTRGLQDVLLFVTDGLLGIRDKLLELFPKARGISTAMSTLPARFPSWQTYLPVRKDFLSFIIFRPVSNGVSIRPTSSRIIIKA